MDQRFGEQVSTPVLSGISNADALFLGSDGRSILRLHVRWLAVRCVPLHWRESDQYTSRGSDEILEANTISVVEHLLRALHASGMKCMIQRMKGRRNRDRGLV